MWLNKLSWQSFCFQSNHIDFSCGFCDDEIESRMHMITECSYYDPERKILIVIMKKYNYVFNLQNVLDYNCNNKKKIKNDKVFQAIIEFLHQIHLKRFKNNEKSFNCNTN